MEAPNPILERLRESALGLPNVEERESHGSPAFFHAKGSMFAHYMNNHHGDGRNSVWLAAPEGIQQSLIEENSEVFFRPPYVGHRGWVGVLLDKGLDWGRVAELVEAAHAMKVKKR